MDSATWTAANLIRGRDQPVETNHPGDVTGRPLGIGGGETFFHTWSVTAAGPTSQFTAS